MKKRKNQKEYYWKDVLAGVKMNMESSLPIKPVNIANTQEDFPKDGTIVLLPGGAKGVASTVNGNGLLEIINPLFQNEENPPENLHSSKNSTRNEDHTHR